MAIDQLSSGFGKYFCHLSGQMQRWEADWVELLTHEVNLTFF
jgi:hypothetical protein